MLLERVQALERDMAMLEKKERERRREFTRSGTVTTRIQLNFMAHAPRFTPLPESAYDGIVWKGGDEVVFAGELVPFPGDKPPRDKHPQPEPTAVSNKATIDELNAMGDIVDAIVGADRFGVRTFDSFAPYNVSSIVVEYGRIIFLSHAQLQDILVAVRAAKPGFWGYELRFEPSNPLAVKWVLEEVHFGRTLESNGVNSSGQT